MTDLEAVRVARVQAEAREHLEHLKAVADLVRAAFVDPGEVSVSYRHPDCRWSEEYKRLYELVDRVRRTAPGL